MQEQVLCIHHLFLVSEEVCEIMCLKREFSLKGPGPCFKKRECAMRKQVFGTRHVVANVFASTRPCSSLRVALASSMRMARCSMWLPSAL